MTLKAVIKCGEDAQKETIDALIEVVKAFPSHTAIELLDIAKRQVFYNATMTNPKDEVQERQIEMSLTNISLVNGIFKPSRKATA